MRLNVSTNLILKTKRQTTQTIGRCFWRFVQHFGRAYGQVLWHKADDCYITRITIRITQMDNLENAYQ